MGPEKLVYTEHRRSVGVGTTAANPQLKIQNFSTGSAEKIGTKLHKKAQKLYKTAQKTYKSAQKMLRNVQKYSP